MKGIVLAGGLGTRLRPWTNGANKHFAPVIGKNPEGELCLEPLIFKPVRFLVRAGISDLLVVAGGVNSHLYLDLLFEGQSHLGFRSLHTTRQSDAVAGIADALNYGRGFADGEPVMVALGDNWSEEDVSGVVTNFSDGAHVFLKEVPDPRPFGVPTIVEGKITEIVEKPTKPLSKFAVTGFYLYDASVWSKVAQLKPSDRGQLEITHLNNLYCREGKMDHTVFSEEWFDCGTAGDFTLVNLKYALRYGLPPDQVREIL